MFHCEVVSLINNVSLPKLGDTMNKKNSWLYVSALLLISIESASASGPGVSYVDGTKRFVEIADVNRQAEAWALCAATYDFLAETLSEIKPAQSKQFSEVANGAEAAIIMAIIMNGLDPEISPERFNALLAMAKLSGTELPKTRKTMLDAELESTSKNEESKFIANLSATAEVCMKNLPDQQNYIDLWRELAKSGLLKLPD